MGRWIGRGLTALLAIVVVGAAAMVRRDLPAAEVEARWASPPSRFVEVDGMRVHVRERGSGPPLLLVHGLAASLFTWEGWAAELSGAHRVIAFDLPGHGLTGPHPEDRYSHADMADFVDHLATALGVTRFSLAGSSMGGHVAARYALAHPERVDRLILVDALGLHREEPRPLIFRLYGTPIVGNVLTLVSPRFVVAASVRDVYGDPGKVGSALVDRYHDLLRRAGNREAMRIHLSLPEEELDPAQMGKLRMPALILWGARDRWILPRYGERFRDAIPGARLVTFEGLGHVPMEEDPVATARVVRDFLQP
jgi:pimeloyl-ACP methyl ester carboxylesterase